MAVRVPDLELQLILHVAEKKTKPSTPPPTHTHICTPLLYYLAWFSRNFSECIFLLIPHCSAMGFGLYLSLNWNIWEEKYTLKICCLVSRSGQLFAESYVFSGSLVVDRWWVCLCCLVSLGLDFPSWSVSSGLGFPDKITFDKKCSCVIPPPHHPWWLGIKIVAPEASCIPFQLCDLSFSHL